MKSPKTKFIIISAVGLASIGGILVSAQSPTHSATDHDRPFHLVLTCAVVSKDKLRAALSSYPPDTYRFEFGPTDVIGRLPRISLSPCPSAHLNGNSTQRAMFRSTQELRDFLTAVGL